MSKMCMRTEHERTPCTQVCADDRGLVDTLQGSSAAHEQAAVELGTGPDTPIFSSMLLCEQTQHLHTHLHMSAERTGQVNLFVRFDKSVVRSFVCPRTCPCTPPCRRRWPSSTGGSCRGVRCPHAPRSSTTPFASRTHPDLHLDCLQIPGGISHAHAASALALVASHTLHTSLRMSTGFSAITSAISIATGGSCPASPAPLASLSPSALPSVPGPRTGQHDCSQCCTATAQHS